MRLRFRPSLSLLAAATAMRRPMMTANLVQPRDTAAGLFVLEQTDKVKSPPRDKKQYRWLRASNGLRVLLVHDPDTEKAAAALEVHAGHFSDPDERPGLAHFTEHMMFHRGVESEAGHGWPAQARWLIGRRPRAAWGRSEAWPDTARSLRQSQLAEGRATLCSCSTRTAVSHRRTPPPGRFLGTESFPEEGAFKAFLQKHGGSSNAFTGMETTGFHFVLQERALRPALKHFSSFFTVSTE